MTFVLDIIRNGSWPERLLWLLCLVIGLAAVVQIIREWRAKRKQHDVWARGADIMSQQAKAREADRFRGDGRH